VIKKNGKKVIVVGAGPGGLASAMILAYRGFDVTVYEKETEIGGRNAEIVLGQYKFDLGPTFLMMKYVLDEIFAQCDRKTESYLDCPRLDPMYRLDFKDKSLMVYQDFQKMRAEIARVFPGEEKNLDRFYVREKERFAKLYPCLQSPYGTLSSFLSVSLLKAFPHIALGKSLYDVLAEYFSSEELRLSFTFQSKYLGMSPWECPGLFAMIPYTEHAHGIYHVKGGLCEISRAFAKVAIECRAVINTSAPVKQILLNGRKAFGVELPDGSQVVADEVVINADFAHAMSFLFPKEKVKKFTEERLKKLEYSCSTFMLYLGLDQIYDLPHHSIVFAEDYRENLRDISERKRLTEDFSAYIRNASINDPTIAPKGHSALYVLVPVPNQRSGIDWSTEKAAFKEKIYRLLETRTAMRDLRQHVVEELVITPEDWEKKRSVYLGATFNLAHSMEQMLYFRPRNKFEEFDNTYLVGGGTHPGSGLPTIFESARISANLISAKHGVPYPAPLPFDESRV